MTDNCIVLDVETGTWGTFNDIIQLSYIIYDKNNQEIKRVDRYIKDRRVEKRAFDIHGISVKFLNKHGEVFSDVMNDLIVDLKICSIIVGHNIASDIKHIRANLCKYMNNSDDIFANMQVHDTMKMGKQLCGALDKNGRVKMPTLGELYTHMLAEPMENAHNALADCECTAKCYFLLK